MVLIYPEDSALRLNLKWSITDPSRQPVGRQGRARFREVLRMRRRQ